MNGFLENPARSLSLAALGVGFLFFPLTWIGPGFFFLLFAASMLLGFLLIVLQVDKDRGENGQAIETLSGEVLRALPETPAQQQDDRDEQTWIMRAKTIFVPLALFIVIFWVHLSFHGLPKAWDDKGYGLLIYMFSYGSAGYHSSGFLTDGMNGMPPTFNGDYFNAIVNGAKTVGDFAYIRWPWLLSIPYAGFTAWAMSGKRKDKDC